MSLIVMDFIIFIQPKKVGSGMFGEFNQYLIASDINDFGMELWVLS